MEVLLQNYSTFKSSPAFFIHQLSFISGGLSSTLTYHAKPQIIPRTSSSALSTEDAEDKKVTCWFSHNPSHCDLLQNL